MSGGIEREVKLSVAAGMVVPELGGVVDGATVEDSGIEPLEADYWDSDGLHLVRRGYGLRHRRRRDHPERPGIWTLKTPGHRDGDALVRGEHEVEGTSSSPPGELLELLPGDIDSAALHPVVRLCTERRVLDVRSADGTRRAEVVDDTVEVHDRDGEVVERFRELEVEIDGDDSSVADAVVARLRTAGAGAPQSLSKYARALRALGHEIDTAAP